MNDHQGRCPGCFTPIEDQAVCPSCAYQAGSQIPIALPMGCLINDRYIIGRVLGRPGGFGITYLAWDEVLDTRMAIKEYFPRDLSGRDKDGITIVPHSKEDAAIFAYGLQQYIVEARTLNQFEHPNIVKVHNYFSSNGTAYMVMEYYQGINLDELLAQEGGFISETRAINIVLPIMDGLRQVHSKGFLHRDIKPGNIYLRDDGRPILLDFGAARLAVQEKSQSLSIIITPGYTPFEQYHRRGRQGPWTDIYSLGAVLYHLSTGITPPHSPERVEHDELLAPHDIRPQISESFGQEVMRALSMDSSSRHQSVEEFSDKLYKLLRSEEPANSLNILLQGPDSPARNVPQPAKPAVQHKNTGKWVLAVLGLCLVAGLSLAYYKEWSPFAGSAINAGTQDSSVLQVDINANQNKAPGFSDSSTIASGSQNEPQPPDNPPAGNGSDETPRDKTPARVTVPNVVGAPLLNARRALEGNNLVVGEVRRQNSEQYSLNTVIKQSVPAGTQVDRGTPVNITVSLGPARIRRQN